MTFFHPRYKKLLGAIMPKTKCPHCNQTYDVDSSLIGQKMCCSNCSEVFTALIAMPSSNHMSNLLTNVLLFIVIVFKTLVNLLFSYSSFFCCFPCDFLYSQIVHEERVFFLPFLFAQLLFSFPYCTEEDFWHDVE